MAPYPANHMHTLVNRYKRTTINHTVRWDLTHANYSHKKNGHSNTKSRVYFWRAILFFQACFCHYHSWSSSCLKSAGRRTAQHSLCTERDGYKEMMGKAGAVIEAMLVPEGGENETDRNKEEGAATTTQSFLTFFLWLDHQLHLISFHFHFPCCLIRRFSLSHPCSVYPSVCGAVFMSNREQWRQKQGSWASYKGAIELKTHSNPGVLQASDFISYISYYYIIIYLIIIITIIQTLNLFALQRKIMIKVYKNLGLIFIVLAFISTVIDEIQECRGRVW